MRRLLIALLCVVPLLTVVAPLPVATPIGPPSVVAAGPGFVGVVPARLLDTREGLGAPRAALGPGGQVDLQVTGRGNVPAGGVSAVVLNVTVTQPSAAGYITVYPTGEARPVASNLNFTPGQTVPNLVIVKVGAGGRVTLFNSGGTSHLVADVSGYYTTGSQFVPTTPSRLLDTRNGTGGVTGPTSGSVDVQVVGRAGVPAGASSVVMNVTVTEPTASAYLTVWPTGASRPVASNLNFLPRQTVPNLVIAKVGTEGKISYFTNAGRVHVVIDVLGYIVTSTPMTEFLDSVGGSYFSERTVQLQGQSRLNSLYLSNIYSCGSSPYWIEYNLGRSWGTLATTVGFDDVETTSGTSARFRILGDGVVLDDRTLAFGQSANVTVNVTNVLRLRFEVYYAPGGSCPDGPVFAEPRLFASAGAAFPVPDEYMAMVPSRILDTRNGTGAGLGRVAQGGVVDLQVLGSGDVPINGVSAVVMNVTVTEPDSPGYVTVWPSGSTRPVASNLNFLADQTVPNLVVVPVGANGRVSLYNNTGRTHLIADVLGWFRGTTDARPVSVELTSAEDSVGGSYFSERTVQLQGQSRLNSLYLSNIYSCGSSP